MLIETHDLTKYYGGAVAADGLNFAIDRGEIVGLLGPNGAGKTTTMRMLTCFLPPTRGTALVAGYDIMEDPIEVRRHVGYMPESNPLYDELRVSEYLKLRAQLKGVPRGQRNGTVGLCTEMCGIEDVRRQVIRTLSKGYRQRVGLADVLLGDPDVLILDEPTIGLDPNQIRQTRATIQGLSERHTILLSTHILQEVDAICQRVLIIDRGRIVADDTVQNLSRQGLRSAVIAEMKAEEEKVRPALLRLAGVEDVSVERSNGWNTFRITVSEGSDVREAVFNLAAGNGWALRELRSSGPSLEDIFYRITMREDSSAAGEA